MWSPLLLDLGWTSFIRDKKSPLSQARERDSGAAMGTTAVTLPFAATRLY